MAPAPNELQQRALERGDRRSSLLVYRIARGLIRWILYPWLRVRFEGIEHLDQPGPVIVAPVHRSHLDSALLGPITTRRVRALGKESLFTTPGVGWLCAALGAIPVRRAEADRDAMNAARMLLDRGEMLVVFPEGTRTSGEVVAPLFDGPGWLAARTGAPVVPIGIAGTSEAFPPGAAWIRRSTVTIVVGPPIAAPVAAEGARAVSRSRLRTFTASLAEQLQSVQDDAVAGSLARAEGLRSPGSERPALLRRRGRRD